MSRPKKWQDMAPKELAQLLGLVARYHILRELQNETVDELTQAVLHRLGYRRFKANPLMRNCSQFLWVPPGSKEFMTQSDMHRLGLTQGAAVAAAMAEYGIVDSDGELREDPEQRENDS